MAKRMKDIPAKFAKVFNQLTAKNIDSLDEIYGKDVLFIDSLREVRGRKALKLYMVKGFELLASCKFQVHEGLSEKDRALIPWTMSLRHRWFSPKKTIKLPGVSEIRFGRKIYYQRDYFDAGRMLYEHLPVLGPLLKLIRKFI